MAVEYFLQDFSGFPIDKSVNVGQILTTTKLDAAIP